MMCVCICMCHIYHVCVSAFASFWSYIMKHEAILKSLVGPTAGVEVLEKKKEKFLAPALGSSPE